MGEDSPNSPVYRSIVAHYEECLARHGPTHRGADWPNSEDLRVRFEVMLGLVQFGDPTPRVLDLGCGPGLLLEHLQATGRLAELEYSGIDMSPAMIEAARRRWPDRELSVRDVLRDPLPADSFDYVLMNGVLTEKVSLSREAMVDYAQQLIAAALQLARRGIAFNVMSRHVDYERADLFHWSFDEVAGFLTKSGSRHYAFRADYGLYEFTTYVFRSPNRF